jgi:membrane associated rhomboid family serine protease
MQKGASPMKINVSMPKLLAKAAPIIRVLAIIMVVVAIISLFSSLGGFITGLVYAAFLYVISILCDCVVELYSKVGELTNRKTEE